MLRSKWINTSKHLEHCLIQGSESCSVVSDSLRPHGLNSPGQNTGMGCLFLLQGIFPTQGSNPGLLHCRWILYQLSHKGNPRILEWVAYPFSRGYSQPRNQTRVSCIAGGFFTKWAMRAAPKMGLMHQVMHPPQICPHRNPCGCYLKWQRRLHRCDLGTNRQRDKYGKVSL